MLVLSRKESQRIRLGDSIIVTIVKISGDKVRVGIEAPANVLVLRDELEVRTQPAELVALAVDEPGIAVSADRATLLQRSA
jgi:carbon storage regulator